MKCIVLIGYSIFFITACNNPDKKTEIEPVVKESMMVSVDSVNSTVARDSVPTNLQVDSIIHLAFPPDSVSVTVKGHLDKTGEPVVCFLPVSKGRKLTASVVPEKPKANIRFSHIYLPNGKSDGPFSPNIKYHLAQKGVYKLYIAPNRMAGDPVSTDFVLKVKVE